MTINLINLNNLNTISYHDLVASCNSRQGNEVGLFCSSSATQSYSLSNFINQYDNK